MELGDKIINRKMFLHSRKLVEERQVSAMNYDKYFPKT